MDDAVRAESFDELGTGSVEALPFDRLRANGVGGPLRMKGFRR